MMRTHPTNLARPFLLAVTAVIVLLVVPHHAAADDHEDHEGPAIVTHPERPAIAYEKVSIGGEEVHYLVSAGTLTIAKPGTDEDEPAASMFYTSYGRSTRSCPTRRSASASSACWVRTP
jgi:hypothetical protein